VVAADSQGLTLTGSGEAVAAYDRAIEHLIRFQPAVVDAAAESAQTCVMGVCSAPTWDSCPPRKAPWARPAPPLARPTASLAQFGSGQYELALAELLPIRTRVHEFGGSRAQRDAVERTLLESAIRAGRLDLANALVSERLSVRGGNTYAWSKRAFLLAATGDPVGAATAAARERELAAQIRAAANGPLGLPQAGYVG
jgi:hypothetical protein